MNHPFRLNRSAVRLALCVGGAAVALASATAQAAVINVDFSGNPFSTVPFNIDGFYLNVVTGATGTSGGAVPGYDLNPYFSGSGGATPGARFLLPSTGGMVGAAGAATPLANNSTVAAASSFINGVVNTNQISAPTISTFGFSFLNEGTGLTNYGYVVVQQSANPATAGSVRVLRYAYDNMGQSITVSPVPEPSTALLMVAGLIGAGAFAVKRRQRGA
ncbi:MAG: PEP-CTERM sorting domain-containing protein [Rubrivivax sp.]